MTMFNSLSTIIIIVTKFDKLFLKLYQKFASEIFVHFIHKINTSYSMICIHTPIAHTPIIEIYYIVKIRLKVQVNTLIVSDTFTSRKTLYDIQLTNFLYLHV